MTTLPEPVAKSAGRSAWSKCPACGCLIYHKRLARNLHVCPECEHHFRLTARSWIDLLSDPGTFRDLHIAAEAADPLTFSDLRAYRERLTGARSQSGESEAVIVGTAQLGGRAAVLGAMEFAFLGGSMGVEVGRRVSAAAETARHRRIPLIMVCTSGGARMQEGVFSLLQMAGTSLAFARLREAGVLSICVLADPFYGGVSASFANLGSVVVAEHGAHIGFAGPRVVQETIRADLPAGFQTAASQLAHGFSTGSRDGWTSGHCSSG